MFSIIIADDEAIERRSLKLLIQKNFPDLEISGLASNGIELAALIDTKQPDIAIVDITMPGMNGLDTIELLRSRKTKTRFIINTAYNEFEFAQRALALKVDAYILKPQKQEVTVETIRRLYESIKEHNKNIKLEQQIIATLKQIEPIIENELMYSIFLGKPSDESFKQLMDMYALDFGCGAMATLIPLVHSESALRLSDEKDIRRCLDDSLNGRCNYISNVTGSSLCIFFFSSRADLEKWKTWLTELLSLTLENLSKTLGLNLQASVGNCYTEFQKMSDSYKESLSFLKNQFPGTITFFEDNDTHFALNGEAETSLHSEQKNVWKSELENAPDSLVKSMPENELKSVPENVTTDNSYVISAMKHIDKEYGSFISLNMVADEIGVSSYYLSRLFKQELGQTFLEYLTQVRIYNAMNLTQHTKLMVNEIAARVGYDNPTYFCRVFKKHTGKSISEIRDENRRKKFE